MHELEKYWAHSYNSIIYRRQRAFNELLILNEIAIK